jgi:hypothetical protein
MRWKTYASDDDNNLHFTSQFCLAAIRGKAIAAEVYNRDLDDFEAGQNLVRVEARRLHRHLAEYYAGPGNTDPWHICIDLGGYVP